MALRFADSWNASASHPFCAVVRTWLRDEGDDPSRFEEEEEDSIYWRMSVDPGLSVIIKLYAGPTGRVFFMMESALSALGGEDRGKVAEALLVFSREIYEAYRVALIEDGTIVCLARGRAEGITLEYFRHLLGDLIELSRKLQRDLMREHGLKAFAAAG